MKQKKYIHIIAEIGVNHNGDVNLAKKTMNEAKKLGANSVKFQTYDTNEIIVKNTDKADYQIINTKNSESQYDMLKKLELSKKHYDLIKKFCNRRKIKCIFSPFDIESLSIIKRFNLDYIKIPSGEINNLPLLEKIAKLKKKIILSTGMATIKEIQEALKILIKKGITKNKINLLQCNTDYPTRFEDVNLNSILQMKKKFKLGVGFSDHTRGIEASLAAVSMGATIIEKHFTISKKFKGPDHQASLEPRELKKLVLSIRNIEKCFGNYNKFPTKNELKNKKNVRKSIVAKKKIKKGEKFTKENLTTKRPGNGISPMKFDKFVNRKAKKNYEIDEFIKL